MNRYYVLLGLLGLMALATPAQAQFFFSRPSRTPTTPLFPGGGYGSPYGYQRPGFGGPFGPTIFPTQPYGPGLYDPNLVPGLSQARQAGQGLADPGSPDMTGHPTRFAAYGGYFNSQGGGTSSPSATAVSRIPPTTSTTTLVGGIGSTPSGTQPSRSKTSQTAPNRQPRR